MADEFQESDVMFESNAAGIGIGLEDSNNTRQFKYPGLGEESRTNRVKWKTKQSGKKSNKSVPMNIPENFSKNSRFQYYEEEGEMVPPHEVVGRRLAGEMACSVCSGNGRTLKGRDLSQVRNSILRMTGFLET